MFNLQARLASSIVPFDSGKSYVVRDIEVFITNFQDADQMGRTAEDRRYLEQFEEIFMAAAKGDLKRCQSVVDSGFRDFSAVSYGKFGTPSGKSLNGISPIKIAEMKGHRRIVEFFETVKKNRTSSTAPSLNNRTDVI